MEFKLEPRLLPAFPPRLALGTGHRLSGTDWHQRLSEGWAGGDLGQAPGRQGGEDTSGAGLGQVEASYTREKGLSDS